MSKTMKAAVIVEPGKLEVREISVPQPEEGEVLIRQHAVALCTMEQRVYNGVLKGLPYPGCWGHEVSGTVAAIGPNTETSLQVGDHVVLGDGIFCGECYYCAKGFDAACSSTKTALPKYDGVVGMFGMAEYSVTESKRAVKVARDIPFEEACFAEPISCAVQSANKLDAKLGETVVVIGAGTMGLLNVMVSKLRGAKVVVSEIDETRRQKALAVGADAVINPLDGDIREKFLAANDGRGADAVIVAIGNAKAVDDSFKLVAPQGKIMLFASAHPDFTVPVSSNLVHRSGIWITGTTGKNHKDFWEAALLLSSKAIRPQLLIEDTYPIEQAEEAIKRASAGGTYRIIITM